MADSLLGQLSSLATPEVLGQVSKMTGVDTSALSQGLGAAGATALGSMANSASSADGLSGLMDMVTKAGTTTTAAGGSGDALGGIMSSIMGGSGSGSSNALLGGLMNSVLGGGGNSGATGVTNSVMGSGINAVSGTLSKSLGFNVAPMLTMAVPALLGLVTKTAKAGNLDANGLKTMLDTQNAAFLADPSNAASAKLAQDALAAGAKGAAVKNTYTDAGWSAIKAAPLAAMAMVTAASPSSGGGAAAEFSAAAGTLSQLATKADPTSLINMAFSGGPSQEEMDAAVSRLGSSDPIALIKAGVDQVAQGNPGEVAAYKSAILSAATAAAEATKEGGFLGMGGQQVSAEEQAVLDKLRSSLN